MNYFKIIGILFFIIVLFGCKKSKQEKFSYSIDLDKQLENEIPFSDVFEDIQIIQLETNKESLIQRVGKVQILNSKFYVFDQDQSALLIFDSDGNFIKKIREIGRGPEEYSEITDFNLNKNREQIELLSPRGIIISYDLDGNFIGKQKANLNGRVVHYFTNLTDDLICFYSLFSDTKIAIYSKSQKKVVCETLTVPSEIEQTTLMPGCSPFFEMGGTNLFFDELDREVSLLTKGGLNRISKIDFGQYNLDVKSLQLAGDLREKQEQLINLSSKFVITFPFYLENESFIIASFVFKQKYTHLILNKRTQKETVFHTFKNKILFPFSPLNLHNDTLITIVEPSKLYHYIPENDSMLNANFQLGDINIEDNPILVKYKMKSND
ncbi:6-bladed beta-propeller [Draconibacterium halophilum]|uniref:6-bladed beta-propeller n=1 Tax=Draconibacterium halophilum TaxID=2706887 RepID=A0A6C0R858_9BACT|nr:6-bladed beta-propeller [Draconibacterium halophilum]QIA06554.1 6-bladed beta-propeller [Draconibacterium halophilum]